MVSPYLVLTIIIFSSLFISSIFEASALSFKEGQKQKAALKHLNNNDPINLGIVLSDTCLILLQNNFSTNCPSYSEILLVYPDTSNKEISGDFEINEYGMLERGKGKVNNHLEYYKQFDDKVIFFIDPPADISLGGHKRIIIAPHNFWYKELNQIITNSSLTYNTNRYISSTCTYAIISADSWLSLMGDTIQLMLADCDPEASNFKEQNIYEWKATTHNIIESSKWKMQEWFKEINLKCSSLCNYQNNVQAPFSNPDYQKPLHIPTNYTIELKETLTFRDNQDNNHTENKILPCELDSKSVLCKLWKYQNIDHETNQSDYLKFRNAIAGAIGE